MSKFKRKVSAGVIVTDGDQLLLGHVTNAAHWDLPKGGVDKGESHLDAAVRELFEETGLQCEPQQLIPLGIFIYKDDKDLALYVWPQTTMPDPSACKCHSTFGTGTFRQPELDGFVLCTWSNLGRYVVPRMLKVLTSLQTSVEQKVEAMRAQGAKQ